jgi:nicotinamidase-related amidase
MLTLDPAATALILVDLQAGIVAMPTVPHAGDDLLKRSLALAERLRSRGGTIVRVHVAFDDARDMPPQNVDEPMQLPPGGPPKEWSAFPDAPLPAGDLVLLKRHWGALHGTDLDLRLRRRGIRTVIVAGIATNYGVESTVRSAWEHDYDVVVVEDLCASRSAELHAFPFAHVFPRIARVAKADALAFG